MPAEPPPDPSPDRPGGRPVARDRSRPRPVPEGGRGDPGSASTSERILDAALASFATRGYEASSLDALAVGLTLGMSRPVHAGDPPNVAVRPEFARSGSFVVYPPRPTMPRWQSA